MSNKVQKSAKILILVIFLMAMFAVQSVGAQPPHEEIVFDPLYVTYAQGNFTSVSGVWNSSEGLVEGSGDAIQSARHAGWPGNGWQFKNATLTTTLSDDKGTITIKDQITKIEWNGYDSTGRGHWVILEGTGAYENLQGRGTSTLDSIFYYPCPDPSVAGPCITIELEMHGRGHYSP